MGLKYSPEGWRDSETGEIVEEFDPDAPPVLPQKSRPWEPFISPATGKEIRTSGQRKEDMKASGCRDAEVKLDGRMKNEVFAKKWHLEDKLG